LFISFPNVLTQIKIHPNQYNQKINGFSIGKNPYFQRKNSTIFEEA